MILNRWTRPDYYAGASWNDYYVFLGRNRDSRLLEVSNFECALAELGGESETVVVVREGHWAVGWVEWIAIHKSDAESLATAQELAESLADYPVLNEDDYFFQQFEQACDTWESMSVRERALLLREAGECIFSARRDKLPNSSRIYEQLTQGL